MPERISKKRDCFYVCHPSEASLNRSGFLAMTVQMQPAVTAACVCDLS